MRKTAFVAFYQGEQLKSRVKKICAGFRATLHQCPGNAAEREALLKNVNTQVEDLSMVLITQYDPGLREDFFNLFTHE